MKTVTLAPGEQIILVLRKHWIIFAANFVSVGLLLAAGLFAFLMRSMLFDFVDSDIADPLITLVFVLYLLLVVAVFFVSWIHTYFDVWIVTNRRIIDIKQRGLFNRETAEYMIANVQDITVEVPSFFSTVLGYGNMTIQTAGEKNFVVRDVPHLSKAKEIMLSCSRKEHARLQGNQQQ